MTKSLSDKTVFGMVGLLQFYSSHSGKRLGHRKVPGCHIAAVNCFPDLRHFNIQGVKTHTVGNHKVRPLLNYVHVELEAD